MTYAYRIANYDVPFWVGPSRSAGRFNRPGVGGATQYLALHPLGCVAEYLRGHGLKDPLVLVDRFVRIWVVDVDLSEAGSLTFGDAAASGLDPHDLISDDYSECQDWADRVRGDPRLPRTWIFPNAALPGTRNVVIFGERVMSPFQMAPVDPAVDLPATIVGDISLLPAVVIAQTRFRGMVHAEIEAWRRGESFRYREPESYPLP